MNINKISNAYLNCQKPTKQLAKAGVAIACGAVAADQFIAGRKSKNEKSEPTKFQNLLLTVKTLANRLGYINKHYAFLNGKYKGEMLNPVLNDLVAKLNTDIYCDKQRTIRGFKPFESVEDEVTGFGATAYRQDNEIFITYRGTNNKQCIKSDWQMAEGKIPEQYELAEKFYQDIKNKYPECDITLTGHSLGGSLAQLVACKNKDVPAITLNAFGTNTIVKRNKDLFKDNHNVNNFIIGGDFVSNTSKHVGETVILDREYYKNKHDMPNYTNRWAKHI